MIRTMFCIFVLMGNISIVNGAVKVEMTLENLDGSIEGELGNGDHRIYYYLMKGN